MLKVGGNNVAQIEGVKELMRKFDQLKGMAQAKVLMAAARSAGNVIAKEAKARIPVGSIAHRTYRKVLVSPGFARRSIVVKTYANKRTGAVGAVVGVRAQAFYAVNFIELERGKSTARGKPWLRPAFEATTDKQISEFHRAFMRVINRVARK
jgi:HK97 gp10 family phage protein